MEADQSFLRLMPVIEGFPRPEWTRIGALIDELPEPDQDKAWGEAARSWLEQTSAQLSRDYIITETDNFFLLHSLTARQSSLLSSFVEKALARILRNLQGIAADDGSGKHVAMIFDDQDTYYRYVSYFMTEDGEFPLSSGMFLNREYGHFALPFYDLAETEATVAHELTHACVRHLPIPLWLNEGLAVTTENDLCNNQPLRMDPDRFGEHLAFWNSDTIQEFWSGASFGRTDEGNGLSYELARYCIRALAHEYPDFVAFANFASFEDGGEAAAVKTYGGSLGGLPTQFFGAGEWSPRPESWWPDAPPNQSG